MSVQEWSQAAALEPKEEQLQQSLPWGTADVLAPEFANAIPRCGLRPGQKVFGERYLLIRILERGWMGVGWLARDETQGQDVALKFLPKFVALDRASLEDLKEKTKKSFGLTRTRTSCPPHLPQRSGDGDGGTLSPSRKSEGTYRIRKNGVLREVTVALACRESLLGTANCQESAHPLDCGARPSNSEKPPL